MATRSGFTLLEMMITVVIVGILAAASIPAYSYYVRKARQAEATTALGDIRAAQMMYRNDVRQGNGEYAADISALGWKLMDTGTTVGKAPALYTYYTNDEYSAAITYESNEAVNNPKIFLTHADAKLLTSAPR